MPTTALKAVYLPRLVAGDWTGTMNLTEPQAGSDVGAVRTRAEPRGDGSFAVTGQKIFISWGDHDMAENVCHLVLARLPDAPSRDAGDLALPGAEVRARRRWPARAWPTRCGRCRSSTRWGCTAARPA